MHTGYDKSYLTHSNGQHEKRPKEFFMQSHADYVTPR